MQTVPSPDQNASSGPETGRRRSSGRPRGADSAARREEILATAARLFSEEGSRGTSMSAVARACGLSQTGLLHYFPGKDQLLAAVMEWRDTQDMALLKSLDTGTPRGWAALERLARLVRLNTRQPGMIRLYTTLAGEATQREHPANAWLLAHHHQAMKEIRRHFHDAAEDGQLRADAPVDALVRSLVAAMDGLQIQWLSDPGYSGEAMAEDFAALIRTVKERWGA